MNATHQHHHDHDHADDRKSSRHHPEHPGAQHAHGDHQAQILDLDAEVLADHLAAVAAWLPVRSAPKEIVDLGAGTGAGTLALLAQFPQARVTAIDSSVAHLEQLRAKVIAANLADRVRIVPADLDAPSWPDLGAPDLVWASASLHHLADPDRALRTVRDTLAPDGLLAVVELAGLPRFLPPTAPEIRPGLEERCHAATAQLVAEHLPHRGADWGPMLTGAGFTLRDRLTVDVHVDSSPDNAVGAYALAAFQGIRNAAAAAISAGDLAALDQLLDPASPHYLLRRPDLAVRTTRTVWAASPTEWFSAAAEAENCERVLGDRRHGMDPA